MPTTYTTNLKLVQPDLTTTGWGTLVNNSLTALVDVAVSGVENVSITAGDVSMTIDDGAQGTNDARNMFIVVGGTLLADTKVTVPTNSKLYFVHNNTAGAHTLSFEATAGVLIPQGKKVPLYSDGTDILYAFDHLGSLTLDTALAATSGGTGQSSYAVGDLLYADTTTSLAKLAAVAEGSVLRSKGTGTAPAWEQVDLTTDVTGILPVANGGTGAATLAANNVLLGNGTGALQEVAPGTAGNVLTSAGGTWTSAALTPYAGPNADPKTSGTGTFTIPTGITRIKVTVVGGGGGSSGCQAGQNLATGGGGGGTAVKWLTGLTPNNTLNYSVGAGGTAGASPNAAGGAGAASTVSSGTETITTITGNGGAGGVYSSAGGNGGTATNGDLNVSGSDGNNASGGTSLFSNGFVATQSPSYRVTATAGNGYGGGASAATQPAGNVAGAAGSGGLVIFEW